MMAKCNNSSSPLERTVTRLLACDRAPEPKVSFIPHKWELNDGHLLIEIDANKYAGMLNQMRKHYQMFREGPAELMEHHINMRLSKCRVPRGKEVHEQYRFEYDYKDNILSMRVSKKNGEKMPTAETK